MTELKGDIELSNVSFSYEPGMPCVIEGLSLKIASPYDQGIIEKMQAAFKDYYDGNVSLDKAKSNFEKSIKEIYPEIKEVNWPE